MKTIKIIGSRVLRPITLNSNATTWDEVVVELAEMAEPFSVDGLRAQTVSANPIALTSGSTLPTGSTLIVTLSPVKNDNGIK